jgi:Tfp pilus assembly protein PilX
MRPNPRSVFPPSAGAGRRRDQRGFSLVILFLIILVMVGIAAGVMVTTQGDLQVSGHEREAKVAYYAAQAGLAMAETYLLTKAAGGSWTGYLSSGDARLCGPVSAGTPTKPPNCPAATNPRDCTFDTTRQACVQYCFHNNSIDPHYLDSGLTGSGDINDADNKITVEAWGFAPNSPNGATSHLVMDVRYPSTSQRVYCYPGQAGCETKQNNVIDKNNVTSTSSSATVNGG